MKKITLYLGYPDSHLETGYVDSTNIRYFSTRLMRLPGSEDSDGESGEHWQREWWRARNERVMTRWGIVMPEDLTLGWYLSLLEIPL